MQCRLLAKVDEATHLNQVNSDIEGDLTVAATYTVIGYFLPLPIECMRRLYPKLRIQLYEMNRESIQEGLVVNRYDISVLQLQKQRWPLFISGSLSGCNRLPLRKWTKGSVMGLFDGLGSVVSDVLNGRPVNLLAVAEDVFQNAGGLDGVLAQLNQSGLGHQVASWIGTGDNIPITADQIRAALSSEQLQGLASKLGVDISKVPELLAEHLPTAVDQASPNGTLPSSAS
ncbi:YidB family protein [Rhizobium ruizarguesonis]|uniref:YidB family protein n=1 Tax=Rhizobium ruizarguesonis TaxID=2081791 RepID=UPI001FF0172A|nr:YidB family protein [Rhizobium ruizarguesonis]